MRVAGLAKTFTLHVQNAARLPVFADAELEVRAGDGVALTGPSGAGKSTFLRCLYGNYGADAGSIAIRDGGRLVEMTTLTPYELAAVRTRSIGYVSQFLRVIPRVPAIDVAAEPLRDIGVGEEEARERVASLFRRMLVPERLWSLSPTTFSGGEKQRINLARTLVVEYPILLLDEPTSALDAQSREAVVALLSERRARGTALVGIYHDDEVRTRLADRGVPFPQKVPT